MNEGAVDADSDMRFGMRMCVQFCKFFRNIYRRIEWEALLCLKFQERFRLRCPW